MTESFRTVSVAFCIFPKLHVQQPTAVIRMHTKITEVSHLYSVILLFKQITKSQSTRNATL